MEFLQTLVTKKYFKRIHFPVLGACGGFAYYYFVGCASGTCAITSNPYISTVYGAMLGALLVPSNTQSQTQKIETEK